MYVFLKFEVKHNSHLAIHDVTLRFFATKICQTKKQRWGQSLDLAGVSDFVSDVYLRHFITLDTAAIAVTST